MKTCRCNKYRFMIQEGYFFYILLLSQIQKAKERLTSNICSCSEAQASSTKHMNTLEFYYFYVSEGFCLQVTSNNQVIAVQKRNKQPGKSMKCKQHIFFLVHIFHLTVSSPQKNCFPKIVGLLKAKFDRSVVQSHYKGEAAAAAIGVS